MIRYLLCLTLPVSVFADSLTVSLEDIPARVRRAEPSLQAAHLTIEEARGRQLGSGRLANPTLETNFQNQSQVSPQVIGIAIDQSFPSPTGSASKNNSPPNSSPPPNSKSARSSAASSRKPNPSLCAGFR
jgi:hypothetical protein